MLCSTGRERAFLHGNTKRVMLSACASKQAKIERETANELRPKKKICWTTAVRLSTQPQSSLSLYLYLALFRILRCSCVASEQQETEVLGHERLAARCCLLSVSVFVCVLFWDSFSAYKSIKTQSRVNLQL